MGCMELEERYGILSFAYLFSGMAKEKAQEAYIEKVNTLFAQL